MKHGPVTKLDKRNKAAPKKFVADVMLTNCDVIVIFPIYGQFGAIRKPDSGRIVCKTYIFIKSNHFFILQKLRIELENLLYSFHTIGLSKGSIFPKNANFLHKRC